MPISTMRVRAYGDLQITALHRQVVEAHRKQAGIDKVLDSIEEQQKQLDGVMTHYESEVNGFAKDSTKPLTAKLPADQEREKSYVQHPASTLSQPAHLPVVKY